MYAIKKKFLKKKIYGWSRYDYSISDLFCAKNIREIKKIINYANKKKKTIAIRSGGYSYGANTLNSDDIILNISQTQKILKFNKREGTIEVTGCCSLKEINHKINYANWYLPVSPAHDGITVSGAISNNVHGKNCFQNGYFGDHVTEIIFLSSKNEIIKCNKNLNKNLFYGLFGSIGFLGIILNVKIKLQKRISNDYLNETIKFTNFRNIINIMKKNVKNSDYIISALDLTRFSNEHGFVYVSKNIDTKQFTKKLNIKQFYIIINILMLLNKLKIFSKFVEYIFHLGIELTSSQKKMKTYNQINYLNQNFLPFYNYIFKKGFIEYQIIFKEKYFNNVLLDLKKIFRKYKYSSYMSSVKYYKPADKKYSFPLNIKGFCITLDIVADEDTKKFKKFKLDMQNLILKNNAQLYFGKNFEVDKKTFIKMYPNYKNIIKLKKKYDPYNVFWTDLTKKMFSSYR